MKWIRHAYELLTGRCWHDWIVLRRSKYVLPAIKEKCCVKCGDYLTTVWTPGTYSEHRGLVANPLLQRYLIEVRP